MAATCRRLPSPGRKLSECEPNIEHPEVQTVDDLIIFVTVGEIDGPYSVLAEAGPCVVRDEGLLPVAGVMIFDIEDIGILLAEESALEGTILHEIAHVLGFGVLWEPNGLLLDKADFPSEEYDTRFSGEHAVRRFDEAGGADYPGGKVPVENMYGEGNRNSHWREAVLGNELLTGVYNPGRLNPFSAITIGSLHDLGYSDINYAEAEPYTLPGPETLKTIGEKSLRFDLADDARRGPIRVIDSEGRLVHPDARQLPRRGPRAKYRPRQ